MGSEELHAASAVAELAAGLGHCHSSSPTCVQEGCSSPPPAAASWNGQRPKWWGHRWVATHPMSQTNQNNPKNILSELSIIATKGVRKKQVQVQIIGSTLSADLTGASVSSDLLTGWNLSSKICLWKWVFSPQQNMLLCATRCKRQAPGSLSTRSSQWMQPDLEHLKVHMLQRDQTAARFILNEAVLLQKRL